MQGILPAPRRADALSSSSGCSLYFYWQPVNSYTTWHMPFPPHWDIGGVFLIDVVSLLVGVVLMFVYAAVRPPFFRGEVLNRSTPTLVPEDLGSRGRAVRRPDELTTSPAPVASTPRRVDRRRSTRPRPSTTADPQGVRSTL